MFLENSSHDLITVHNHVSLMLKSLQCSVKVIFFVSLFWFNGYPRELRPVQPLEGGLQSHLTFQGGGSLINHYTHSH